MNVKPTAIVGILLVALLQQGCIVGRVATAPLRFAAHQVGKARAEKRGERLGEKRAEKRHEKETEDRPAPPSRIAPPDTLPPEPPTN